MDVFAVHSFATEPGQRAGVNVERSLPSATGPLPSNVQANVGANVIRGSDSVDPIPSAPGLGGGPGHWPA